MKLQVNNSGAWKQVLVFGIEHLDRVQSATADLAQVAELADSRVCWRILDGNERCVMMWGDLGWYVPRWALNYELVP